MAFGILAIKASSYKVRTLATTFPVRRADDEEEIAGGTLLRLFMIHASATSRRYRHRIINHL